MTLARRPQTQLTRLSDHAPKQEILTGFGTTVTKVVDLSGGDPVQVTSINVSIFLGIVLGCAMSPAAIFTVPMALISGAAIVVNDLIVCSQYQASLEAPDEYQSPEFWEDLPEFVPNVCADCQHFQSMRDRSQPSLGHCSKWGDSAQATEVCDDWQQFAITVPHKTILPEPIEQPEPTPIATPQTAKPTMVSRKAIETSAQEELQIAQVWKAKPAIEPLSDVAAFIDKNLQNALQQEPRGFSNTVPEVVEASGLTDLEVIEYFKELSKKRPESYTLQRFGTIRLTVQGVA